MNIFSNPIIHKNIMSQMRRERIIGISVGYISFIALLFLLNFLFYYGEYRFSLDLFAIYKNIYLCLLILQFCLYFIFSFNTSGLAIIKEREQRTYEFFKTLPMSYKDIIIGEMIGPTLSIHYLQLITIPLTLIIGLMAKISILVTVKLYIVLILGVFFLNALGLLISSMVKKQTSLNLILICIIGLIIGAPCIGMSIYRGYPANFLTLLSPIPLFLKYLSPYYRLSEINAYISFFEFKIPILIYTCLIYTCLGITFLAGVSRKIRDETAPPFSRKKVPFMFLIFEIILIGFMRDAFRIKELSYLSSFSAFFHISWFVLVILSLILTPDYVSIFNWLKIKKNGVKKLLYDLFSHNGGPIFIISIICYFIMTIVGLSVYAYLPSPFILTGNIIAKIMLGLGILFGYLLVYILLYQFCVLVFKENGPTFGAGFVMVLYIIPFLLFAFSQFELFLFFNPTSGSYLSGAFVSDRIFDENWGYGLFIPFILTTGFAVLLGARLRILSKSLLKKS